MIVTLLLSLAAAPDATALVDRASARLAIVAPAPDAIGARYRVDATPDDGVDAKTRAVNDTGTPCDVVGARRCTRKPRTLLKADLNP